jgi:hypothetical protein
MRFFEPFDFASIALLLGVVGFWLMLLSPILG